MLGTRNGHPDSNLFRTLWAWQGNVMLDHVFRNRFLLGQSHVIELEAHAFIAKSPES